MQIKLSIKSMNRETRSQKAHQNHLIGANFILCSETVVQMQVKIYGYKETSEHDLGRKLE